MKVKSVFDSLHTNFCNANIVKPKYFCLFFVFVSFLLFVNSALAHESPHQDETIVTTARDVDNSSKEERDDKVKNFVEHALLHLSGAESFTESLHLLNDFRNHRDWVYGSTYILLTTKAGGVYIHPKSRELEDQDWSEALVGCNGESWNEIVTKEGGCVRYEGQPDDVPSGYAMIARGPFVPFGNPSSEEAEFVLIGGLDYTPEPFSYATFEELEKDLIEGFISTNPDISAEQLEEVENEFKEILNPVINAVDVETQDDLRRFLLDATRFISASFSLPVFDPVILRKVFRFDGGPWRNGSTYIYIMDIEGNVVFNGANRNIEQTDLWNFEGEGQDLFIRRIIDEAKKPGGGFVGYDWDDPNIEGDEPDEEGAAGGTSSKLGYAVLYRERGEDHLRTYVFGTGLYFDRGELVEDDGGCSLSANDSSKNGSILANSFVMFFLLFFAISIKSSVFAFLKDD